MHPCSLTPYRWREMKYKHRWRINYREFDVAARRTYITYLITLKFISVAGQRAELIIT